VGFGQQWRKLGRSHLQQLGGSHSAAGAGAAAATESPASGWLSTSTATARLPDGGPQSEPGASEPAVASLGALLGLLLHLSYTGAG